MTHFENCPWCRRKTPLMCGPEKDELGVVWFQVVCFECGCLGPARKSENAAINHWNRR